MALSNCSTTRVLYPQYHNTTGMVCLGCNIGEMYPWVSYTRRVGYPSTKQAFGGGVRRCSAVGRHVCHGDVIGEQQRSVHGATNSLRMIIFLALVTFRRNYATEPNRRASVPMGLHLSFC